MRAIVSERLGRIRKLNDSLEKSTGLARKGGFIRVFLDLGKPMRVLLERMQKQDQSEDFIKKILAAFELKERISTNIKAAKRTQKRFMKSRRS